MLNGDTSNLLPTNTPRRKPGDVGSSTATCGSC